VAELVDAADLNSAARKGVRVRISAPVPPVASFRLERHPKQPRSIERDEPEDDARGLSPQTVAGPGARWCSLSDPTAADEIERLREEYQVAHEAVAADQHGSD
jgi:hypothetical protein